MSNKKRFIPLAVIGAVLMSLLVIAPVFSDDGELELRVVDDEGKITSKTQQWVKQEEGEVGIRLTDADLNIPIKHVLLPGDISKVFGASEGEEVKVSVKIWSKTITVNSAGIRKLKYSVPDGIKNLAEGDTVLISGTGQTVREVSKISTTADEKVTIEVKVPFHIATAQAGATLYRVNEDLASAKKCSTCAMARKITKDLAPSSRFDLDSSPIVNSQIIESNVEKDGETGLKGRFSEGADSKVDESDVLILGNDHYLVATTTPTTTTSLSKEDYEITDSGRIRIESNVEKTYPASKEEPAYALYWAHARNITQDTVTAESERTSDNVVVVLLETGVDSGVFVGTLKTSAKGSDNTLKVVPDDEIEVKYDDPITGDDDPTETIIVETTSPTFANFAPENGHADRAGSQEVEADVTDSESGISSAKNIWVVFAESVDTKDKSDIIESVRVQNVSDDDDGGTSTNIDDGFKISITNKDRVNNAVLFWWVVAEDVAGNIGVSDRVTEHEGTDSKCMADEFWTTLGRGKVEKPSGLTSKSVEIVHTADNPKTDRVSGCQPYSIRIDNESPEMSEAYTGQFWDLDKDLKDGDKDRTSDRDKSKPESIRVKFNEDLDGSTVSKDDFEVDGSVPSAADFYTDLASSVFLTVPTLDANDKPSVELVGEVADRSGNKLKKGAKKAEVPKAIDRILPTLTVTLEGSYSGGSRVLTDKDLTVTVESDEPISPPAVIIHRIEDNKEFEAAVENDPDTEKNDAKAAIGKELNKNGDKKQAVQVKGAKNTYSVKYSFSSTDSGLYSVYVEAKDTASGNGEKNKGIKGATKTSVDTSKDTKDLLFEVDTKIAKFKVEPEETNDPKAFITLDYSGEANEYYKDAADSKESKDYDSFSKLTIVEATLIDPDGEKTDITDALNASANSAGTKFRYNDPDGLALGEYKLEVKAKDEAGNEDKPAQTDTFEVKERPLFKVDLAPGSNFVSFPSNPQDPDINKVIPADHPIARVLTYDPKVPGGWLTAVRGEDGMFDGTLKELTANRAYIITTDSFEALEVSIPKPSASAAVFLPKLDLSKGWNLVPIIDIDGNNKLDDQKYTAADEKEDTEGKKKEGEYNKDYNYFGITNAKDLAIFTFTTQTGGWSRVDGQRVELGKGYWVYSPKSMTLIPQ